jgi:Polyketide cyclase / dehydrase and lipid transport
MRVNKHIDAAAERVWAILADFADVSWIPVAGEVSVEGEGPGMRRLIGGSGTTPVAETLLWIKPEQKALSYEIANNPLPVRRFLAVVTVTADDGTESTATWDIEYEPEGDDAEARSAIETVYGMMADWLAEAATPKP